jgi:proteasome lid subunit RPN8/RPN11
MVFLKKEIIDLIVEHAKREVPLEACGILAGKDKTVEAIYPMKNMEESPTSFFMEPKEQLKVMKDIRNKNMEMIAIYHSHPYTRAYPSVKDVELAYYPEVSHIIISLMESDTPQLKSYKIVEGKIEEEEIKIIDSERG